MRIKYRIGVKVQGVCQFNKRIKIGRFNLIKQTIKLRVMFGWNNVNIYSINKVKRCICQTNYIRNYIILFRICSHYY